MIKSRWLILMLLAGLSASALPVFGQSKGETTTVPESVLSPNAPTSADIDRWIRDLGDDAYSRRQEAAVRLLAAGMTARQPLVELAAGPDPETRAAARRIVALIDRTEFRRRLEAFAADSDGRKGLTLPGWERFQAVIGGDPAARALFVEMQRQEGAVLAAAFGAAKSPVEELWEARLQRLAQWPVGGSEHPAAPATGSCAAMIFLGLLPQIKVSDSAATQVQVLIQRPPVKELLAQGNPELAVRKLVVMWLLQCPNKNDLILQQRLAVISMNGLREGLPLALQICDGGPQYLHVQPFTKAGAAQVVGQFGGREHVERLEPLLDDSSVCLPLQVQVPGQPPSAVQVRDVALVVLLYLTGQSPADYGYAPATRAAVPRAFQLQTFSRENNQQRAEAIAKWQAWRTAQTAPPSKPPAP